MARLKTIFRRARAFAMSPALLLYIGSMARAGFAFLLGVIIARQFGPAEFGLFHAYTVLMALTLCVVGEAMDHGLIRHYTYRLHHASARAGDVLGSALALRVGVACIVAIITPGILAALTSFMPETEVRQLVLPGLFAGALAGLVTFVAAVYIAQERFFARAALLPALAALRLCIMGGGAIVGGMAIGNLIWLDAAVIAIFAVFSLLLIRQTLAVARVSMAMITLLGRFSGWSIATTLPYVAYMGLGSPLLLHFHGPAAAGVFGVAISVAVLIEHATAAFISVLQREVSAIRKEEELRGFLRTATRRALLLVLLVSPFALFGGWLIPLAFGPKFADAVALFPLIMVGALLHMASMPRALIFLALDRPGRLSVGAGVGFAAWVLAAVFLVPSLGAFGAVYALLIARATQAVALTAMVSIAPFHEVGRTEVTGDLV